MYGRIARGSLLLLSMALFGLGCGIAVAQVIGGLGGLSGLSGTNTQSRNEIFQVGMLRISRSETVTAFAGGGQASATQLVYGMNRVTTVATAADSVKLPVCLGGKMVVVANAAASNAMNVYGQTGETINALSANTALSVAANKVIVFFCANDGNWYSLLTA